MLYCSLGASTTRKELFVFVVPELLLNANAPDSVPLFQLPPRLNQGLEELAKLASNTNKEN